MRRIPSTTLVLGGLLLFATTPALTSAASPGPSAGPTPLEGTSWGLTNLRLSGAYAPLPDGPQPTMTMAKGTAGGFGGCNDWSAAYLLDGTSLSFGQITSTLMLCEGIGGTVETFFFADLPAVAAWSIEGNSLTLSADDGQPVVAFEALPAPTLEGSWLVASYLDAAGGLVSVDDGGVTLVADSTSVSGTAGCNGFSGAWTLADGTLAIGPLMSTRMACEPASVMARESAVIADLEASTALRATPEGGLRLLDSSGAIRLVLAPVVGTASPTPAASPAA